MAVSAVSSVGRAYLQLFRLKVEGVAEDASPVAPETKDGPQRESGHVALDPRRPESILAGRKDERDIRSRMDDLLGQKSALERRQAEQSGQRSAAVMEMIAQLRSRDGEVRAHEAAHMAAGGRYITGGASYSYERGPDGALYAVGGEVGVDTSPVPGDPEATAEKMRIIRAAALAPSDPSGADLSIAAAASQMEAEALSEITQSRAEELAGRYSKAAGNASGASGPNSLDLVA